MIEILVAMLGPLLKVTAAPPPVPHGATGVRVFLASQRYLSYRYLITLLSFLPIAFPIGMLAFGLHMARREAHIPAWVGIGVPAALGMVAMFFLALAIVSVRLDYEMHCYVATDQAIRIRQGIWEQVEATLTYANVQNVRVVQGPLERVFGIASVIVETAGSAKRQPGAEEPRGLIRGIENAEDLRDRIMAQMRASKSAGLGDPDDHEHHEHAGEAMPIALLKAIRDEARGLAEDLKAR